ncbi:calcium channel protein [Lunasporangiospora selenospora]|uniref:Calcium-channel protein CCH1 n=1 Tax=Lunasporangiospora selenospora TaxID=979761 RepID=A0A9P6KI98_9FUNG|nr:calcium channel protein [Lunasporangiospora selenospora]
MEPEAASSQHLTVDDGDATTSLHGRDNVNTQPAISNPGADSNPGPLRIHTNTTRVTPPSPQVAPASSLPQTPSHQVSPSLEPTGPFLLPSSASIESYPASLGSAPLARRTAFPPGHSAVEGRYDSDRLSVGTYHLEGTNDRSRLSGPLLRRRRHASLNTENDPQAPTHLPRSLSITSYNSSTSAREPHGARGIGTPTTNDPSQGHSKWPATVHNRSSISGPPEQPNNWISGLSDVVASVSSRVVNSRSQEQPPSQHRLSMHSISERSEGEGGDSLHQRGSIREASPVNEVPPWVAPVVHAPGSDHGSAKVEGYPGSKRSSGSHAGGSNLSVNRLVSLGPHGEGVSAPDQSRPAGSHIDKSNSILREKQDDDEESFFAPGGFKHRGGQKVKLEGRSLKLFSPHNRFRCWLLSVLTSKYTDPLILLVILTQWVFFVITPTTKEAKNDFGSYWTHYGLLAINIIFTLEITAKAIVYGLFFDRRGFQWEKYFPKFIQRLFSKRSTASTSAPTTKSSKGLSRVNSVQSQRSMDEKGTPGASQLLLEKPVDDYPENASTGGNEGPPAHAPFFRSYYNRLDVIVVVSYWIDLTFMLTGVRDVYIFKALSALRPLRLLSVTEGTSTIIDSLSSSAPLLLTILGFIFFFFLILSLIGLLVFQGALSRRCAVPDDENPNTWEAVSPEVICGGYYSNGTIKGIVGYIGQGDGDDDSPRYSGMICPEGQICMQFPNYNPLYGLVSFDNIFLSLLTVFTISSMEGWTDVEYWVMDGDSRWAAIYFCSAIFLMSFLMIPLFIAGITYSFGAVRAEKRHSAFSSKPRIKRVLLDTAEGWQFEDQVHQARSTIRHWLIRIVNDPWFPTAGAFLVFLNMLAMCFRRYDNNPSELRKIEGAEFAFTIIFLIEICIRIAGHTTWSLFWKRKSNKCDLFLAIVTTVLLLPQIRSWEWYRYLTVFQVMRSYRLIPAIPGVRDLMKAVIGSAQGMFNLLLITFVFLLPVNFDDLGQSFISLFVILTGENWVNIMYEGLDAHQERYKQVYGVIFFVVYYCASHYILLNLFVAIVLEHFELDDEEKYRKQLEMYFEKHQRSKNNRSVGFFQYINPYSYLPAKPQNLAVYGLSPEQTGIIRKNVFRQFMDGDTVPESENVAESKSKFILLVERVIDYWFPTQEQLQAMSQGRTPTRLELPDQAQLTEGVFGFGKTQEEIDASLGRLDEGLEKITWNLDRPEDPRTVRKKLSPEGYRRASAKASAAAESAEDMNAESQEFLEAHPMILAEGFLFTPTGYLRDLWNCMDLCIVTLSCVRTFAELDHHYSVSRAARALSCLQVLRLIRYFEGVSAMFRAITKAMPRMVVALVLTALLFWPFAIYAVNIFAGYFYLCNDRMTLNKGECVGEFMSQPSDDDNGDILIPRIWSNPYDYSFDTVQAAVLTLFEMASQEGWVLVMQSGRAVPDQLGEQPFILPDEPNRFNSFFFIIFMLIGSIVFVQIFIGVILETFKTWNGISLLTVEQRRWIDLRRQLRLIKPTATPDRPKNKIRAICYDLVSKKKGFLWKLMTGVLVLNVILIASQHYAQPQVLTDIQDVSYFIFLGLYTIEIGIKISGYGFHKWRLSRWNLYDFVITVLAIITLIPRFIGHELWTLRLEKFLLITISFRLAQRIDSLQVLFRALAIAFESIVNITAVFTVVFVVYAIMFRELFGMTRLGPSTSDLANFESFGNTVLMLIRMTTGENWDFVMHDMMVEPPRCTPSQVTYLESDCGSRPWAYFMFLSFYIICTYVLLNMFIAVIISNFSFAYQQDSITTLITREDLRNFKMTWAKFDPRGTGFIGPKDLSKLLRSLEGRFCTRIYESHDFSIPSLVKKYTVSPTTGAQLLRVSSISDSLKIGQPVTSDLQHAGISPPSPQHSPSTSVHNGLSSHWSGLSSGVSRRWSRLSISPRLTATSGGSGDRSKASGTESEAQNGSTSWTENGGALHAVPITVSSASRSISSMEEEKSEKPKDSQHQNQQKYNLECIDFVALQQALSRLDIDKLANRRQVFNMVFKEAMATCTSRGLSFYNILDILSFTLVNTEQALGMEEFLKRHERVKEIKAAVARETIHNLLMTIIARRKFLKQRRANQNSRLRPEVPRIVIDTSVGNERSLGQDTSPMLTSSPSGRYSSLPSPLLDFSKGHGSFQSDDDISPCGFSTNTMLSTSSLDSMGWDALERDNFYRQSGFSDSSEHISSEYPFQHQHHAHRPESLNGGQAVEGVAWFNMLQDQIREQDAALLANNLDGFHETQSQHLPE